MATLDFGYGAYEGDFECDVASGGTCVNGIPNGKGKFTFRSGNVYEGELVNGYPHGKGKHIEYKQSGDHLATYEGDFLNGVKTGKGKYTTGNNEYEGDFVDGIKNGKGKYTDYFGIYEGDFVRGDITKGKFTGNNGDTYEGNFANGFLRNGEGKYTFKDGKVEDGLWYNNKYMGEGDAGKLKMEAVIRAEEEEKNKPLSDYDQWMEQLKGER
jgi:hypothetical protein